MSTRDLTRLPKYKYGRLESSNTIRLLRMVPSQSGSVLRVELYRFPLSSCPAYTALSYCWGDNSLERSVICNGARIDTTRSLYSLVDALRLYNLEGGRPYYWIDQICVNQTDFQEREAQVRIMGKIYKTARACLVYLGEATEEVVLAFKWAKKIASIGPDFERYILDPQSLARHNLPPRGDPCWRAIQVDLRLRPWFRRMWVVQEVSLSKDVYMFLGGKRCDILRLHELVDAAKFLPAAIENYDGESLEVGKLLAAKNQLLCVGWLKRQVETGRPASIVDTIGCCWLSECRDPHDKIYAMLGVLSASQVAEIPIDYSMPWKALYEHVARCLVRWDQGSEMLKYAGIDTTAAGSPSWVPNWNPPPTAPQRRCSFLSWPSWFYRAGGRGQEKTSLSPNGFILMALGFKFDTVAWMSHVAPNGSSFRDWHLSVKKELVTEFTRHRNGQSLIEAYQLTLVGGLGLDGEKINQRDLSEIYDAFDDQSWRNSSSSSKHYTLYKARKDRFYEHSGQVAMGSRLCITARGYIGLVPSNTKLEDHIVVLSGHMVPLVLRSRDGKYRLVGESYIQGIMEGEAFESYGRHLDCISVH